MTASPRGIAPTGARRCVRGILLFALAAAPLACGDPGTGPGDEDDDGGPGLAAVTVIPDTATLDARGDTADLDVEGSTPAGREIEDYFVTWNPADPTVVTVNRRGVVTARDTGETPIVAALRDDGPSGRVLAADTARVTVTGLVAATVIRPAGASLESVGDTVRFRAEAVDAVDEAVEGVTVRFGSTDSSVVTVSPAPQGGVVATAVDTGVAEVVATPSIGPPGTAPVEVARPEPRVDDVLPDTLTEGEPATLRGRHLASAVSEPVVRVQGARATVIAVSDTAVRVQVPRFGCRPLRTADVRVIVVEDTADAGGSPLRPDEPELELAPGERRVITGQDHGHCLQFGAASDPEEYLVGVQSVSAIPGITGVALTAESGLPGGEERAAGSEASSRAGSRARSRLAAPAASGSGRGRRPIPAQSRRQRIRRRHDRREVRLRRWELEHLAPRIEESIPRRRSAPAGPPVAASHGPGGGPSVPASVSEGDTVDLRVPEVRAEDVCASYESIRGVVREIGAHGIWIEDTANPDPGYSAEDWTDLSREFDKIVHPTDVEYFGAPTDVDGNDRVVLLVTRAVNEAGLLGFVFAGDLFPRNGDSGDGCATSDEGELAYLVAPDPEGIHGGARTVEARKGDSGRLTAHELAHVIQLGTRMECDACRWMPSFVSEGQAVVAEEVTAHAASGRGPGNDYGSEVVWKEPWGEWYDNRFVDLARYFGWGGPETRVAGAPEECSWLFGDWAGPCIGTRGVYGVPSSIMRWIADHFGPDHPGGEAGLFRDMTASTEVGYENWEDLTGLGIGEILADWAAALWTDNRIEVADPRLRLPSWDLADIFGAVIPEARLRPDSVSFVGLEEDFGVNAGSAAYFLVGADARPHTAVRARSPDGSALLSHMQLWVVRVR